MPLAATFCFVMLQHNKPICPQQQQPGRLQQQKPHQQEMLKFVRKSDTDSVASSSSGNVQVHPSTSNNVMRMPANEQNRHFQVGILRRTSRSEN